MNSNWEVWPETERVREREEWTQIDSRRARSHGNRFDDCNSKLSRHKNLALIFDMDWGCGKLEFCKCTSHCPCQQQKQMDAKSFDQMSLACPSHNAHNLNVDHGVLHCVCIWILSLSVIHYESNSSVLIFLHLRHHIYIWTKGVFPACIRRTQMDICFRELKECVRRRRRKKKEKAFHINTHSPFPFYLGNVQRLYAQILTLPVLDDRLNFSAATLPPLHQVDSSNSSNSTLSLSFFLSFYPSTDIRPSERVTL